LTALAEANEKQHNSSEQLTERLRVSQIL